MEFKKEEEYMKIIKGFVIAFSIYSKIPVPQFDWKEEDMQYHLCFFPLIGLIIGALEAGWFFLGNAVEISHLCKTLIAVAISLLLSLGASMWMGLWIPWMHFIPIRIRRRSWQF